MNKSKKILNTFENIKSIAITKKIKDYSSKIKKGKEKQASKTKEKIKKVKSKKKIRTLWVRRKKKIKSILLKESLLCKKNFYSFFRLEMNFFQN